MIGNKKPTIFFLILGIAFMSYGIIRKEYKIVESKSNIICLECIGIG